MHQSTASPYERKASLNEMNWLLMIILSLGFHFMMGIVFFLIIPTLEGNRKNKPTEIITVELLGSLAPPAPAAPANLPVNPKQNLPDVVEAPKSDPAPSPQPPVVTPKPVVETPPADVIPLGPKVKEKPPEIKKKETPPPKVTPPKVEPPKPPKPPVAKPNSEAELNKALAKLERKVAAEQADQEIDSRMINLAKTHGAGEGEGSENSGSTGGERIDPIKAAYYRHIKDIVSQNWLPPATTTSNSLKAIYLLRIEPSGQVSYSKLMESSGDPDFDLSIERAVNKSSPFPPLPEVFAGQADQPALVFTLKELQKAQQ